MGLQASALTIKQPSINKARTRQNILPRRAQTDMPRAIIPSTENGTARPMQNRNHGNTRSARCTPPFHFACTSCPGVASSRAMLFTSNISKIVNPRRASSDWSRRRGARASSLLGSIEPIGSADGDAVVFRRHDQALCFEESDLIAANFAGPTSCGTVCHPQAFTPGWKPKISE